MPVSTIYVLRHALRLPFTLDPRTGVYTSPAPSPTGLPGDPPLSANGVQQTYELGHHLTKLLSGPASAGTLQVYSSRFYRCPQTIRPWVEEMAAKGLPIEVRGETGIGEWFGYSSRFTHPRPLSSQELHDKFFPFISESYSSSVDLSPNPHGEFIAQLHDRVAKSIAHIIRQTEEEFAEQNKADEDITLLLCFHAAPIIAAGRALTGQVPEDWTVDDFKCYTAGLSKFVPKSKSRSGDPYSADWRNGGICGGWICEQNSDTSFLPDGAERGWHFHGDEEFDTAVNDAGGSGGPVDIYGFSEEKSQDATADTSKL